MPSGSLTPPSTTPPLATAASTSYGRPAAAHSPAEQDPFLARAAGVSLTDQDRQEGYDLDLVYARPRGGAERGSLDDDESLHRGEKYAAGGGAAYVAGAPPGAPGALGQPLPAPGGVGLPAGASGGEGMLGAGLGGLGKTGSGASAAAAAAAQKEYGGSGTTARSGHRKPWFLRPLPLGILVAFIVAVALAVGLGVGLSERHSSNKDNVVQNPETSGGGPPTSTGSRSRSRTSSATTGTVVPSSLFSSYTSDHPATSTDSSEATDAAAAATATETPTEITSVDSSPTATTLATSGNIPVPATAQTTISGVVYSALSTGGFSSSALPASITASARMVRRQGSRQDQRRRWGSRGGERW
ncbi:hypothetical protein JCM8097_006821 [Rhodosporidiobolus ruineniae]